MDTKISEKKYKADFGIEPLDEKKLELALEHALDIRKFEIELYWKRASYFWTLIAAAFAGYFVILAAEKLDDKRFFAFVVACIGFFFTFAWYQVNRGSKQWQENWENHVDMLEDATIGPLYKTTLARPREDDWIDRYVTGPADISVSKTNQVVSLFTLAIWIALAYFSLEPLDLELPISWKHLLVSCLTLMFTFFLTGRWVRTYSKDQTHVARQRKAQVGDLHSQN